MSWWRSVLDVLWGFLPDREVEWSVLTVSDGSGNVVARRRFERRRDADRARRRFAEAVAAMSEDDYAAADWQAVLDRA
jgi:hypothetical protein